MVVYLILYLFHVSEHSLIRSVQTDASLFSFPLDTAGTQQSRASVGYHTELNWSPSDPGLWQGGVEFGVICLLHTCDNLRFLPSLFHARPAEFKISACSSSETMWANVRFPLK